MPILIFMETIQDRLQKLIGVKFNRLTILGFAEPKISKAGSQVHMANCQCDCGKIKVIDLSSVKRKNGGAKSCGCYGKEKITAQNKIHGLSKTTLYRLLNSIKNRCYRKETDSYCHYGARGITVCDEWLNDFMAFRNWCINNGWQKGLQIDRKDNDGNYEPSNCRFTTPKINCRNRRNNVLIEHNGESRCISEWAEITGINKTTIWGRYRSGWNTDKIFSDVGSRKITPNTKYLQ